MITVYVWNSGKTSAGKNVGHASMNVGGHTYVSWWPDEAATFGSDYHPIRNQSYEADVQFEGHPPDASITIDGLDELKILDWWAGFGLTRSGAQLQGPLPPYNITRQNCSTVVANGLKVGGGDDYAGWFSSWNIVWMPGDVQRYAYAIRDGLMAKK